MEAGGAQSTCGGTSTTAGHGGTIAGVNSINTGSSYYGTIAYGGTQTAGGGFKYGINPYYNGVQGGFGYGAHAETCAAGGGGGYYGGGSVYTAGGGGGSSFVTGYTGCDTTYRANHKDQSGNLLNFTHVKMQSGQNDGNGKVLITYLGMNDEVNLTGQVIVEVSNHISADCAVIDELEFYDQNNQKLMYTTGQAFDSANNSNPYYWTQNQCWWSENLYDGQIVYTDNSTGRVNCTAFLYTSAANSNGWARFIVNFAQGVDIGQVKAVVGGPESRMPGSISVYKINNYSETTYNNNVTQRKNDGLTLFALKNFTTVDLTPTTYALDNN